MRKSSGRPLICSGVGAFCRLGLLDLLAAAGPSLSSKQTAARERSVHASWLLEYLRWVGQHEGSRLSPSGLISPVHICMMVREKVWSDRVIMRL